MESLSRLFCKSALEMTPYSPIEPPDQIALRLGLKESEIVKLDANENPFGTIKAVNNILAEGRYFHIYPDPAQVQLREAIAEYTKVAPENLIAGTGADELIDIVCRLLLEPGDKVISFTPTFSYYSHVIALNKGHYITIEREKDYSISLEKVKGLDLSGCKLVILCSPNNPSGNLLEEAILDYFLEKELVVLVDEAYYEFSRMTVKDRIHRHNNLLVLRTFSKCFGLAGLRVGYGIGSTELIAAMMKIKPPFSVNVAAEMALKVCLEHLDHFNEQVERLIQIRESALRTLSTFDQLEVYPSQSNFILCRVRDASAKTVSQQLEHNGVLVRYFATNALKNCIRISVGTESQMDTLFTRLKELIN